MKLTVVIIGIVLVVALVVYFATTRRHPENASGHEAPARTGSAQMFGDSDDRPAGPGAEDQNVVGDGQIAPGPDADNLPWPADKESSPS